MTSSASNPATSTHRDLQGLDDLADQAHLLAQDVGRLRPTRLVVVDHLVAEGGLGPVEGDRDVVGVVVLDQVDEHRREPEHGVGDLPGRGGHVGGQGEEGPVGERVAVDEHGGAHGEGERYRGLAGAGSPGRPRLVLAEGAGSPLQPVPVAFSLP